MIPNALCCSSQVVKKITRKMKIFAVIIFASCMFAVQAVTIEQIFGVTKNCGTLNGLDATTVKEIVQGKHITDPTPNVVQHLICGFTESKTLNADGSWNHDQIKTVLGSVVTEAELKKIIDECAIKKDTVKESAVTFWRCAQPIVGPRVFKTQ